MFPHTTICSVTEVPLFVLNVTLAVHLAYSFKFPVIAVETSKSCVSEASVYQPANEQPDLVVETVEIVFPDSTFCFVIEEPPFVSNVTSYLVVC